MEIVTVAPSSRRVFLVDNGQPRLIDALPIGLPRLIDRLIGAVQRRHPDLLPRALNTLRALLSHANHKSNRVWASLVRLGLLLVGKDDDSKDKGKKLAQRGVEDLCKAGLIRKIVDKQELLAGPGEHDFVDAGGEKKGDGAVNHYDCSALVGYIDPEDVADWDALMGEGRVFVAPYPAPPPPRDLEAVLPSHRQEAPPASLAASNTQHPTPNTVEEADPFDEPALPSLAPAAADTPDTNSTAIASAIRASLSLSALPASAFISPETTSHLPCYVAAEVIDNQAEQEARAQPSTVRRGSFSKTDLSNETNMSTHSTHAREGDSKQANIKPLTLLQLLTSGRDKGGRGMDVAGAQLLISSYAEEYVRDLVEYVAWREAQDGIERGGGYLVNTASKMDQKGSDWPWQFKRHLAAKKAQEARERRQAEKEAKQRSQVPEGVEGELLRVWPRLLRTLKEQYHIRQAFLDMHVAKLRRVEIVGIAGDTIVMEAANPFSYKQLSLTCTDAFSRALTGLLGRPMLVQFVPPQETAETA